MARTLRTALTALAGIAFGFALSVAWSFKSEAATGPYIVAIPLNARTGLLNSSDIEAYLNKEAALGYHFVGVIGTNIVMTK